MTVRESDRQILVPVNCSWLVDYVTGRVRESMMI